jgi:hypothetical protein
MLHLFRGLQGDVLITSYSDVYVTVHCGKFLIIKPTRCTNFSNLFWNETLHVSDSSSVHHQEFLTVHMAMVYVIQVCWQLVVRKPVWHIPLLCVQWETPDDGQGNCPKHAEFHSKNKFEKSVHLVGFISRNLSRCTVTWTSNTKMYLNTVKWKMPMTVEQFHGHVHYITYLFFMKWTCLVYVYKKHTHTLQFHSLTKW